MHQKRSASLSPSILLFHFRQPPTRSLPPPHWKTFRHFSQGHYHRLNSCQRRILIAISHNHSGRTRQDTRVTAEVVVANRAQMVSRPRLGPHRSCLPPRLLNRKGTLPYLRPRMCLDVARESHAKPAREDELYGFADHATFAAQPMNSQECHPMQHLAVISQSRTLL